MTTSISVARQCLLLASKDLRLEARSREALLVTAPFGAVALLLVPMAVGTDAPLLRQVGPGMYWVVVVLFGVLIALRHSAVETPAQLAALRLCGVHPAVRLLGRQLANAIVLLAFEVLLAPVAVVLYDPVPTGWPWLVPVAVLVAVGLAALGTFADAVATGLAERTALGPLLVIPLAVPLLLSATQAREVTVYGRAPWSWLLMLLTVDLGATLALAWCGRHLEDVR